MPIALDLDRLLNKLSRGVGMFSPLSPFKSEKMLAKAVAPALVGAAGGVVSARDKGRFGLRSALATSRGGMATARLTGRFGLEREELAQAGATERERMRGDTARDVAFTTGEAAMGVAQKQLEQDQEEAAILRELSERTGIDLAAELEKRRKAKEAARAQ